MIRRIVCKLKGHIPATLVQEINGKQCVVGVCCKRCHYQFSAGECRNIYNQLFTLQGIDHEIPVNCSQPIPKQLLNG